MRIKDSISLTKDRYGKKKLSQILKEDYDMADSENEDNVDDMVTYRSGKKTLNSPHPKSKRFKELFC